MKSQTGQLARRASNAVMPIEGALTAGARKTSFRGSTTFAPYKSAADDNSDESDEDSDFDLPTAGAGETIRPGTTNGLGTQSGDQGDAAGQSGAAGAGAGAEGDAGTGAVAPTRSPSIATAKEKK